MAKKLPSLLPFFLGAALLAGGCSRGPTTGGWGSWAGSPPRPPTDELSRLEAAAVPLLRADRFAEILVLDFTDGAPSPAIRTGDEVTAYLVREMGPRFSGRVARWPGTAAEALGRDGAVVISGTGRLDRRVRKALRGGRLITDGPFRTGAREIVGQVVYTLTLSLSVAAEEGPLYEREFKEDRVYEDLEKPPDFALLELLDRVRDELFPVLFGPPAIGLESPVFP